LGKCTRVGGNNTGRGVETMKRARNWHEKKTSRGPPYRKTIGQVKKVKKQGDESIPGWGKKQSHWEMKTHKTTKNTMYKTQRPCQALYNDKKIR